MRSLDEFDYYLWTTNNGPVKKYWAKIKRTGEVTEISHEVMKFLRSEEKRMRRELNHQRIRSNRTLHLSTVSLDDVGESWLENPLSMEEAVCMKCLMEDFRNSLSPKQRVFFDECLCYGLSQAEFAAKHGISRVCASKYKKIIIKKAKRFFQEGNY